MKDKRLSQKVKKDISELGARFVPFKNIIREIFREYESFESLREKKVVELGPGRNFSLIEHLSKYADVEAVGLSVYARERIDFLVEKYVYDYLRLQKDNSIDLIYSRRVMEKHSFDSVLLRKSEAYRRLLREGPEPEVWIDYPGAKLNIIRCYMEAQRVLKPGGVIISHVGNRYMGKFHDRHIEMLGFKKVITYPIRILGQMWVFRKNASRLRYTR